MCFIGPHGFDITCWTKGQGISNVHVHFCILLIAPNIQSNDVKSSYFPAIWIFLKCT